MSTRARLPRKATTRVSYGDPPAYEALSSDEEDEAEMKVGRGTSGRNKGKGKARSEPVDETSSEDDEPKPKRRSKKRKAPPAKKQKKGGKKDKDRGKLEALKTLPVELLVEIFSHLNPVDLLSLIRTSKTYYALLSAPGSVSIWKQAREEYDLPDKTAGGFTEIQYAQLMFSTTCQHCGTAKVRFADCFIRQRICVDCRRAKYIRLSSARANHPHLHPRAVDCVIETYFTPSSTKRSKRLPHGSLQDIEYYSEVLWKLQYEDEDEGAAGVPTDDIRSPSSASPEPTPARRASSRSLTAKAAQYVELSDDEPKPYTLRPSRRVDEFVESRQELREALREEAQDMIKVQQRLESTLMYERSKRIKLREEDLDAVYERINDIEDRAMELGYHQSLFTRGWYDSKLVVNPAPLTDDLWAEVEPGIVKLLERLSKVADKRNAVTAKQRRQEALRPRYDKLKKSLATKVQPFVPLFVDFLLLPSVIPLWRDEPDDDQDDHAHARRILDATTDPDEENADPDDEDEPDISDAFFTKATSVVACSYTTCGKSHTLNPEADFHRREHVWPDGKEIGALAAVLEHQHKMHNFVDKLSSRLTSNPEKQSSQYHVRLPLEIACATSAIIELADLDPETATQEDLSKVDRRIRHWEWENSISASHTSYTWGSLLRTIKYEVDKGQRLKPPLALEPPIIVLHPYEDGSPDWVLDQIEEEDHPGSAKRTCVVASADEDEDDDESGATVKTVKKARRIFDESDEENSDDLVVVKEEERDDEVARGSGRSASWSDWEDGEESEEESE
ncbi:hypothetical protein JCM8097_003544 [Rhodosporidiobolus ruineniae]